MQNFISYVFQFFYDIYDIVFTWFYSNDSYSLANNFFTKQIFNGDLISIGLTWEELLRILLPFITLFFFIYLIFRLVLKVFGLFRV